MLEHNTYLQSVGESLVKLGELRGDAEVDCSAIELNNESTNDFWVDLLHTILVYIDKTEEKTDE